MRDVFAYNLSREMGHYASWTVYVELFLNKSYEGVYILIEKIKRSPNRVNISDFTTADTIANTITGGYILKIDRPSHHERYLNIK